MQVRDRIKELRRVPAGELQPHPHNWRIHPVRQREALRSVLAEIGYADALLVRELSDGSLQLIDGHLRAETTPDALVPVLVLDVDETEANKILLTHDPLSAMATASEDQLASLLAELAAEDKELEAYLESVAAEVSSSTQSAGDTAAAQELEIPACFQVVVECADESDQQAVYERLRGEGYPCRVLTL